MRKVSGEEVKLRNQALMLFIWDTGARAGEALQIQMKHVHVNDDRLHVKIHGNKRSKDRRVEIFQGTKTLIDFIEQHPKKLDPEAALFYSSTDSTYQSIEKRFVKKDPSGTSNSRTRFQYRE
jgi:integrase